MSLRVSELVSAGGAHEGQSSKDQHPSFRLRQGYGATGQRNSKLQIAKPVARAGLITPLRFWRMDIGVALAKGGGVGKINISAHENVGERAGDHNMPSKLNLPKIIREYVAASNRHDVPAMLACFTDGAIVLDEGEEYEGKKAIQGWVTGTIEKYRFRLKPLACRGEDGEMILAAEVSGTFEGSPVTLDYHFIIEGGKILSLAID